MDISYIKPLRIRGMIGAIMVGTICLATNAGLAAWIPAKDVNRQRNTPPGGVWTIVQLAPDSRGTYYPYNVRDLPGCRAIDARWPLQQPRAMLPPAGLFKGTTALGMCISSVLDSKNVSYIDQPIIQFTLYTVGLVFLLGIIWFCVKDTNFFLEDNFIAPHQWEERARIEELMVEE